MPEIVKVPKKDFEEMEKGFERMKKEISEWEATLETLKDEEVMKQIRQSENEIKEEKSKSWKEVKKDL
ncbi:MAG: hypothetical protein ABEK36_00240 [Candidatus Aenigmatarchaeota archaeon]